MSLKDLKVICLDAQTTGMRPPTAQILELGWSLCRTETTDTTDTSGEPLGDTNGDVACHLMALEEGARISPRVSEITGLSEAALVAAPSRAQLQERLRLELARGPEAFVIHYAQFEKPFLLDLLGLEQLPLPVLCTHQLVKRLFPNLPSQNIRATAGFFGPPVTGHNRAGTYVRATMQIWQGLLKEFERLGLNSLSELLDWQKQTPRLKATRYEYRIDKIKRLELPESPGIYRMLGKNREILYVGKATSLRARVNSYFRGKKGRDSRKLEMLAQVWDLEVTACPTPLEAALLESDEIKRWDPPYHVALKTGRRRVVFYARDFTQTAATPSVQFPLGPYRPQNWIETLKVLVDSLNHGVFAETLFFNPLPEADLRAGYALLEAAHHLENRRTVRALLAYGLRLHREYVEPLVVKSHAGEVASAVEDEPEALAAEEDADDVVTVEDIRDKFERLLRRAGAEYWRTRRLLRLLNARVDLGGRYLMLRNGQFESAERAAPFASVSPWTEQAIATYDRLSILLSEIDRAGLPYQRYGDTTSDGSGTDLCAPLCPLHPGWNCRRGRPRCPGHFGTDRKGRGNRENGYLEPERTNKWNRATSRSAAASSSQWQEPIGSRQSNLGARQVRSAPRSASGRIGRPHHT